MNSAKSGRKIGESENVASEQVATGNFFGKAKVKALPEDRPSKGVEPTALDVQLHTLLYELQEEVEDFRRTSQRFKQTTAQEQDLKKMSSAAIVKAEREKEELRSALQTARHDVKSREKELEVRIQRVDTAVRSELSRKDKTAAEEVQLSFKEFKAKAAEREAKFRSEVDQLRSSLQEEKNKSARLEATVRSMQLASVPLASKGPSPPSKKGNVTPDVAPPTTGHVRPLTVEPSASGNQRNIVTYRNGDTKETDPISGVSRHWFASQQTLVTTHPDGTKVLEFKALGQKEVHHPDGSRDVYIDNQKTHFPANSYANE
jgi:hypothetical protein